MIINAPSQPFFHNLSLMNLDIDILENGHDVSSSYVVVLGYKKLHTPSVGV